MNIKSKGKWITCYIELPTGYTVDDIDMSTVILTINNNSIPTGEGSPAEIGDYDNDGISDLMVKFDRGAVQKIVTEGSVEMTVTGSLIGGTQFEGVDTVLVIDKGQEHIDELVHGSVAY